MFRRHLHVNEGNLLQVEEKSGTWHTLEQGCSLAREQNELLMNELQLQKDKLQQVQVSYDEKGRSLSKLGGSYQTWQYTITTSVLC
jgi:hypothetical protein